MVCLRLLFTLVLRFNITKLSVTPVRQHKSLLVRFVRALPFSALRDKKKRIILLYKDSDRNTKFLVLFTPVSIFFNITMITFQEFRQRLVFYPKFLDLLDVILLIPCGTQGCSGFHELYMR